jgi:hypothetical protein
MIVRTLPGLPGTASLGVYGTGRVALAPPAEEATPRNIEELCEQFIDVCESAVDALEISSALEFDGLNDQAVRKRYGVSDVFALAEEMYRRVPRRPAEPEPVPDPWPRSKAGPALHGLLYGLPTICFPAAAGLLVGQGVLNVLVVALLTSWALSQPLAYLGYAQLGRADKAHAAGLLLPGVSVGTAGVALAMGATALTLHVRGTVYIFGIGVGVYMLGATALMVLGAERLLLVVLAPGVLGSAVFLALGRPPALEHAVWIALAATPVLALGLAIARTSRDARPLNQRGGAAGEAGLAAGAGLGRADLRGAVSSAGFGLTAAGLLVFPVAVGLPSPGGASAGALLASLPLALSMGGAEWVLISFRRRTQRLLRNTREVRVFATRARLVLLAAVLQYLAVVSLLTTVVMAIAAGTGLTQPHWADVAQITAYLLLGGSMFLALLLQAFGSRTFPLIACAVALAVEVATRGLGVSAQIVACTELLLVLAGYAGLVLGRAVRHAY